MSSPEGDDRARIETAILRLGGETGKAQLFLLRLGEAWARPVYPSCLRRLPPRVEATEAGVRAVARWTSHPDAHVRLAALSALHKAGELARPVLDAVTPGLADPEPLVRIAAARVLERLPPCPEQGPSLRLALSDDVFTVRWLAIRALARGGDPRDLVDATRAARPRLGARTSPDAVDGWVDAVAALGEAGVALAPDLAACLDEARARFAARSWLWDETIARLEARNHAVTKR